MARGLNKLQIFGNLGKEPEMRYTPTGKAVTTFSVAVNESWNGTDGEKQERTEWFNCEAWGKNAETLNEYLRKGSRVFLEGRIQTDKWETGEGEKHTRIKLIVSSFIFLDGINHDNRDHAEMALPQIGVLENGEYSFGSE